MTFMNLDFHLVIDMSATDLTATFGIKKKIIKIKWWNGFLAAAMSAAVAVAAAAAMNTGGSGRGGCRSGGGRTSEPPGGMAWKKVGRFGRFGRFRTFWADFDFLGRFWTVLDGLKTHFTNLNYGCHR